MAKRTSSKETLEQNVRYSGHSELAVKFINCLMYDGKKATAQRVVYGALKIVEGRVNAFFKQVALLDQDYAKDNKLSVAQVAKDAGLTLMGFARFKVGA